MSSRTYTKRKRAEAEEETRRRIVDATVALHEEFGPAKTPIAAIAEEAGVTRLTVYRHFPDLESLFQACSTRYLENNPPPDPEATPAAKLLEALYAYYRRTQGMWSGVYRDVDTTPALAANMAGVEAYLDDVSRALARGAREKTVRDTYRHGVRFLTWTSLADLGLSDKRAAALVDGWAAGAKDMARSARRG